MKGGLAQLAYERLRGMMLEPEWAKGGRLPAEDRLAEMVGVSRRVLRSALSRLRAEGLITSRRGSGNYVVAQDEEAASPLDFQRLAIRSLSDLEACLKFRRAIEVAAAEEAAIHASSDDIASLDAAIEVFTRSMPGQTRFEDDFAFHLAVSQASKNMFFAATIEGMKPTLKMGHETSRRLRQVPLNESRRVMKEHKRVVDAIKAGDRAGAGRAMAAHLDAGIERLFGTRPDNQSKGSRQ